MLPFAVMGQVGGPDTATAAEPTDDYYKQQPTLPLHVYVEASLVR
jgi:hypothetical protein